MWMRAPPGGWEVIHGLSAAGTLRVAGAERSEAPVLGSSDQPWRRPDAIGTPSQSPRRRRRFNAEKKLSAISRRPKSEHRLASWRTRWSSSAQAGVLAHRLASSAAVERVRFRGQGSSLSRTPNPEPSSTDGPAGASLRSAPATPAQHQPPHLSTSHPSSAPATPAQHQPPSGRHRGSGFRVRGSGRRRPLLNPALFSAALRGESLPSFRLTADS